MSSSVSCVTASVRTSLWLIGFSFVFVFFFFSISSTTAIFYHPAGACLARYGRTGLFFHVVGEGVVRLLKNGRQHISDRENYIDFRMRLLGEPGNAQHILHFFFFFLRPVSPSVNHTRRWAAPPVERRRRFIANISPLLVSLFQSNMTRLMKCTCNTVIWRWGRREKMTCIWTNTGTRTGKCEKVPIAIRLVYCLSFQWAQLVSVSECGFFSKAPSDMVFQWS